MAGMKYCRKCGKQISAEAKFCMHCGFNLAAPAQAQPTPPPPAPLRPTPPPPAPSRPTPPPPAPVNRMPVNTMQANPAPVSPSPAINAAMGTAMGTAARMMPSFHNVRALSQVGEFDCGDIDIQTIFGQRVSKAAASVGNMAGADAGGFRGIINLIKDPKAAIAALLMTAFWIILPPLAERGILPAQILSVITFANGGLRGGTGDLIGGLWGKSMLGGAVISLFHGGFGNFMKCFENLFANTGEKVPVLKMIGGILLGVVSYYVLCYLAAPYDGAPAAGIGGSALFLQASGKGNGSSFLKGLSMGYAIGVVLFLFI